ncbi:hypothetical protein AHF37_02693 [Paragonimus kellicotti]|nr:hypothetical protein AHF37_02693 [Paragonimus kellicotti]
MLKIACGCWFTLLSRFLLAGVSNNLIAYVVLTSTVGIPAALSLNGHWFELNPRLSSKHAEDGVGSASGTPHSATGRIKPKVRRPDEKTIQRDMNTERMNRMERPKMKGITAFEPIDDIDPPSSESSEGVTDNEVLGRSEQRAHRAIQRERLRRTLFVGNLPLGVKRRDLEKLFTRVLKCDNKAVESDCRVESVRLRGVVPVTGGTGKMARKRAVIHGEFSGGGPSPVVGKFFSMHCVLITGLSDYQPLPPVAWRDVSLKAC